MISNAKRVLKMCILSVLEMLKVKITPGTLWVLIVETVLENIRNEWVFILLSFLGCGKDPVPRAEFLEGKKVKDIVFRDHSYIT